MEKMEDYLKEPSFHPELEDLAMPPLEAFENVILYGAPFVGKYTQALKMVRCYSSHKLKYEKKVSVDYNGAGYMVKLSDVHFEVDMDLLGNSPKPLWHEIYTQIKEISKCARTPHRIVICKNFHKIDQELLEIFYSYMQDDLKFILLTEAVSFIPTAVTARCKLVPVERPVAVTEGGKDPVEVFCEKLWPMLTDKDATVVKFREELYTALTYDLDVDAILWCLARRAVPLLSEVKQNDLLDRTVEILRRHRNNYRPIYHLETFVNLLAGLLYV